DIVARRPRNIRYNSPFSTGYSIDKTGFSGIRWTSDDDAHAVFQRLYARPLEPSMQLCGQSLAFAGERRVAGVIALIIVNGALGFGRQRKQARLPFTDLSTQATLGERQRGPALR